jgi:hypothetical protein
LEKKSSKYYPKLITQMETFKFTAPRKRKHIANNSQSNSSVIKCKPKQTLLKIVHSRGEENNIVHKNIDDMGAEGK